MLPLIAVLGGALAAQLARLSVPWTYRDLFERVGVEEGVDENLLHALAWHESRLTPSAVGAPNANGTRDYGMMQINEVNFTRLGLTKQTALDPEKSVRAAARLLKSITATPGLSTLDVISIYNAGPSSDRTRPGLPKRATTGGYVNPDYVYSVGGKYAAVSAAALAPARG